MGCVAKATNDALLLVFAFWRWWRQKMRLNFCCTAFLLSLLRQRGFSLICVFHIFPAPFFPRAFVFQCFWQFLFQSKAVLGFSAFWVPFVCICSVFVLVPHIFSRLGFFVCCCFFLARRKESILYCLLVAIFNLAWEATIILFTGGRERRNARKWQGESDV